MITTEEVRKHACAYEGAEELAHFERTSFRVKNKIFATMDEQRQLVCLMLSPIDQSVFCLIDSTVIYPVPNKWGAKGATYVELSKVRKSVFRDALEQAYKKCCGLKGNLGRIRDDAVEENQKTKAMKASKAPGGPKTKTTIRTPVMSAKPSKKL